MPLSEHEQKMLDEMERALYAEDPRFASQMRGSHPAGPARGVRSNHIVGAVGVLLGVGVVVAGVSLQQIWLGAVGFALMVAAAAWALAPKQFGSPPSTRADLGTVRRDGAVRPAGRPKRGSGGRAKRSGTFMQRLEQRWDERRRENGF